MSGRRATLALIAAPCLLALAGCGGGGPSASPTKATGGESVVTTEPVSQLTAIGCGAQFRPPSPGPLTLTARFPATVTHDDEPVAGSVDAVGAAAVHGVGPGRAEAFLVRDGLVVTVPVPQDSMGMLWELAPGAVKSVPADVTLTSCAAGGAPIAPGTYDLFVRIVLTADDGGPLESVGGPWPLQVQ
jgi:predicted small lipoprotein YifL